MLHIDFRGRMCLSNVVFEAILRHDEELKSEQPFAYGIEVAERNKDDC